METISEVKKKQYELINQKQKSISDYINTFNKEQIESVLLSGSVSRGTFMPGTYGGAIDLTVFVKSQKNVNYDDLFGLDIDDKIPGHFIKYKDDFFQIKPVSYDFIDKFAENSEAEKFAFLESRLIYDQEKKYQKAIELLKKQIVPDDIRRINKSAKGYMYYLINDYKVDRWKNRNAVLQLNNNLNISIQYAIKCLFYKNGKYYPAEDRALYFSLELDQKPDNFESLLVDLQIIKNKKLSEYLRREKIFKDRLVKYIEE